MPPTIKTTINLPSDELDALKRLARRRSISLTHALRQAIQTELFVQGMVDRGGKLLVQASDGELQQLVFSQTQSVGASETDGEPAAPFARA